MTPSWPGSSAARAGPCAPSADASAPRELHDVDGLRFAETGDDEEDYDWVEVEEEVEVEPEPASAAGAAPAGGFQAVPSDDIDDEIREVFVEEVAEEIDNINRQLPAWKADIGDAEKLKPVRRSFHTLKGSGRLVGAMALGEFSWKIENMLNRVLDKSIPPSAAVLALLDHAAAALPPLLSGLRGEGPVQADLAGIMAVADKLTAGEEAWLRTAEKIKVKRTRRVRVPRPRPAFEQVEAPVELTDTVNLASSMTIEAPSRELEPEALSAVSMAEHVGPFMPALDPMLLEILRSEVEGHLGVVRDWLAACERSGAPLPATEAVLRAVHTMHGAISMADVPSINEVVGPLEGYVRRLRGQAGAPTPSGLATIADTVRLTADVIALLDRPGAPVPDASGLAARLEQLRSALPEPEHAFSVFDLALEEEAAEEPVVGERDALDGFIEEAAIERLPPGRVVRQRPGLRGTAGGGRRADRGDARPRARAGVAGQRSARPVVDRGALRRRTPRRRSRRRRTSPRRSCASRRQNRSPRLRAAAGAHRGHGPGLGAGAVPRGPQHGASRARGPDADADLDIVPIAEDVEPEGVLVLPDMDEDLIEIFVEEGNDILDKADALVARLREAPTDHEAITGLQRHLHTLKGNARAVGLAGVGDLSHAVESLLEAVVGDRMDMNRASVDALERAFDRLHRMVGRVARRQAVGTPQHMIARFEALVEGESFEIAAVGAAAEAAPPAGEPEAAPAAVAEPPTRPAPRRAPRRARCPKRCPKTRR